MKNKSNQKTFDQKNMNKNSKKIKFNLNKSCLQCFIAQKDTKKLRKASQLTELIATDIPNEKKSENKQITVPLRRVKASSFISNSYKTFNNQLLVMEYGKDQVYVDSTKTQEAIQDTILSPRNNEPTQEDNEIVNSCIRVITQETNYSSDSIVTHYDPTKDMNLFSNYGIQDFYRSSIQRNKRAISMQESKQFIIDVKNIEQDGRSTIMVRNIPNKYSQQMLLQLFMADQKTKKFDFFYLPIDYKNNCNVGYAFLNFLHPKFIKDFYFEFHGKKWNKFNSQKICQVCYARIQGTLQLAYHFENSKIIQQRDKKMRPIGLNIADYAHLQSIIEKQKKQI